MLVTGPTLAIFQQAHAATKTKKQEQNTIQGLRGNLPIRTAAASQQQHIDQENQYLRTGKCSNAALGEQTLGNDNSNRIY